MAATKISALGTLAQDNIAPASDLFNLVDVSDTTMGAGGTNKKVTLRSAISKSLEDMVAMWNNPTVDFTAFRINAIDMASSANSLIADFQVNGVSQVRIHKNNRISFAAFAYLQADDGLGGRLLLGTNGSVRANITNSYLQVNTGKILLGATSDRSILNSTVDHTLDLYNGTNPQAFNIYNTYTNASNYERGCIKWDSNVLLISTAFAGTGLARPLRFDTPTAGSAIQLYTGGTPRILVSSNGIDFVNIPLRASTSFGSTDLGAGGREFRDLYLYRNIFLGAYLQVSEMTAPAAPAANDVRIYAADDGNGKTRLMALFANGVAQQIAIEP